MKLLITFLLLSSVCFGQSKKDQIEGLNKTIDSLNTVLSTTRENSSKEIGVLNSEIAQLKSDVSSLESTRLKLTSDSEKLKIDLAEMSKKNLELEAKLKAIESEASNGDVKGVNYAFTPIANLPDWVGNSSCVDCILYPLDPDEMSITEEEVLPLFIYDIDEGNELFFILNGKETRASFEKRDAIGDVH